MKKITPNSFDRSKPFYPVVINYVTQLLGFKELAIRGIGIVNHSSVTEAMSQLGGLEDASEETLTSLRQSLEEATGPLRLRSEFSGCTLEVDAEDIARELAKNSAYLGESLYHSFGAVFVVAHEISKEKPWHDKGPLWEFLRHCRNAEAHGGHFHFLYKEPKHLAKWGPFEISKSHEGTPLFKRADGLGMLSSGDPIRLLWDLEQAYPQMSV